MNVRELQNKVNIAKKSVEDLEDELQVEGFKIVLENILKSKN